jgi:hypothetical protein
MAQRARDTVRGQTLIVGSAEHRRQQREHLAFLSGRVSHRSRHRHVTDGALVLNRSGAGDVIDRFPSHRRLPVRIARRIGHHRRAP